MSDKVTLNLTPKKYECSNGHRWEDPEGTSSFASTEGWCLNFLDPRTDTLGEMSLSLGPFCNICLHQRLGELLAGMGIVTERNDPKAQSAKEE